MSDLQNRLRTLTGDQPQQPGDRIDAVMGKARRIRARRATLSLAAVLVVAAPVVGLIGLPGGAPKTAAVAAVSPVASWPDRSRTQNQAVAQGALDLFVLNGGSTSGLRWLYRGQLGSSDQYLVAFLADKGGVPTVVVGHTQLSQVDGSGRGGREAQGSYPWVLYDAPASRIGDQVATFVNTSDATTLSTLFPAQQVPDYRTTLFVLGSPGARRLDWSATPLPSAPTGVTTAGALTSVNGVFVSDALRLNGLPSVRLGVAKGGLGPASPAGLGSDQPNLFPPEPPVAQDTGRDRLGGGGSTDRNDDGTWGSVSYSWGLNGEATTTFVRCYGGGRLTMTLADNNAGPSLGAVSDTAPCDNQTHEVLVSAKAPSKDATLDVSSDRLQVFTFVTRKS